MAVPYAFVTLITSDSYLPGALALAAALKDVHPHPRNIQFQTVCLVTPETVDVSTIKHLRRAFDVVIGVELITQPEQARLILLGRPDLTTVLTKLHVFRLIQYSKVVFLDADVLPVRPLSQLFALSHEFSAAPDVGWPDIFNTGVMVLTPGQENFNQLTALLKSRGSWDGGDQGILNEWRGNNWNRLSFTYNTTPTAAYTYAPAYERYGSQISAIHFIGPNKPWNSLSYRFPSTAQASSLSKFSDQAYDYNSLVDRWYAVYDKHYRTQATADQRQFEVKRYESAWNELSNAGNTATPLSVENTLSLEELRRLAIEGMNAASQAPYNLAPDDEGAPEGFYQSMPIEGRVDLMRSLEESTVMEPQLSAEGEHKIIEKMKDNSTPELISYEEDPRTPTPRSPRLSSMQWRPLLTPEPYQTPSSPHPQPVPLPPVTPTSDFPMHTFHAQSEIDSASHRPPNSIAGEPEHEPQMMPPPSPDDHARQTGQPTEYHQEEQKEPPRPHSPTMLLWNPAIEPPPTEAPALSSFPSDTYFQNAWDSSPSKQSDYQPQTPIPSSTSLFEPLPRSEIPTSLVKQGHYRNVTGEEQSGFSPSPDTTKVKHVFPWEDKPRHLPGRVFPTTDSPKPTLFLSPESQSSQTSSELPTTPETKPTRPAVVLSPLHGLPTSLTYPNAWDHVPSIQRYASRLVRPSAPRPLAPAFDEDGWNKQKSSWDEKAEASSRDGDVEDEGEDSADEPGQAGQPWDDDGEPESAKALRQRSRRDSPASPLSPTKTESKGRYRDVGVQTLTPEMQSRSVQTVNIPLQISHPENPSDRERQGAGSKRHWSFSSRSPPSVRQTLGPAPATRSPPTTEASSRSPLVGSPHSPLSSNIRSPSMTQSRPANISTSPLKSYVHLQSSAVGVSTAPGVTRQPSNDSSLGSPASSVGPISPPDGQPIGSPGPPRRGSRVWDPARGVELFKRGSEEVLARFLKMGSWDDEAR